MLLLISWFGVQVPVGAFEHQRVPPAAEPFFPARCTPVAPTSLTSSGITDDLGPGKAGLTVRVEGFFRQAHRRIPCLTLRIGNQLRAYVRAQGRRENRSIESRRRAGNQVLETSGTPSQTICAKVESRLLVERNMIGRDARTNLKSR